MLYDLGSGFFSSYVSKSEHGFANIIMSVLRDHKEDMVKLYLDS